MRYKCIKEAPSGGRPHWRCRRAGHRGEGEAMVGRSAGACARKSSNWTQAINTHSFVLCQTRRTPRRTTAGGILYGRRAPTAAHCGPADRLGCWRRLWDKGRPRTQGGCLVRRPDEQLPCRFLTRASHILCLFLGLYEAQFEDVGETDNREPIAICWRAGAI